MGGSWKVADVWVAFVRGAFVRQASVLDPLHSFPQAVLFGRWEVGGVGVRGSITYRLTNPGLRLGLLSLYVMLPLTPTHQTSHLPNNTACALPLIAIHYCC